MSALHESVAWPPVTVPRTVPSTPTTQYNDADQYGLKRPAPRELAKHLNKFLLCSGPGDVIHPRRYVIVTHNVIARDNNACP